MRPWPQIFCQHSLRHYKQCLNMLSASKAQPNSLAMVLLLNLDFSFSGTAAKKIHVLYTKIAGSYLKLWEQDVFPKTKCFIEHSVIKPLIYVNLTNHNWVMSLCVEFNQKVQALFPPVAKRNHKLLLWRVAANRLYENLFKPTEINNQFSLAN